MCRLMLRKALNMPVSAMETWTIPPRGHYFPAYVDLYLPGPEGEYPDTGGCIIGRADETGWVAVAIIQASDAEGLNETIVKEGRSREKEAAIRTAVIQRFQTWRTGKLRLLLYHRDVGVGARNGERPAMRMRDKATAPHTY